MKNIIAGLLIISFHCGFAQMNPQSKKVTEKFFPEMEFSIETPAFQKEKGFTKHDEMIAFLDNLIENYQGKISYEYIGESQKGKKIPMVRLRNSGGIDNPVKFWIQAGLHGNEPASTEGILYLISQLLTDDSNSKILNNLDIAIIPMANIDGYEKQNRYADNGLDLNRDQTKLNIQESIALKTAFSQFNADVAIDMHEYRPYRRDFARLGDWGITSPYDVMFLYSGNLNVPQELRNFTKEMFVGGVKEAMEDNDLVSHDYFSSTKHFGEIQLNEGSINARSSATSYALTNCISTLFEVRGVGLGRTSFKRRVFTTYTAALSYMNSAANNIDEVHEVVNNSRINNTNDVVINSQKSVAGEFVPMIDLTENEMFDLDIVVRDAFFSTSTLSRSRPHAYIILPGNDEVLSRLSILGISLTTIESAKEIEVETYTVSSYIKAVEKYEGVFMQSVKTNIQTETVEIPAGSTLVYMDQDKANLAVEVLEPEASNSFISFNVLPTSLGSRLPIYRYLIKENL